MHNRRTQRADVKHMRTGDSLLRLGALSWETKYTTDEGNMAEFFSNPSLLTKDRLKAELQANGISLPKANQKKDFYVDLYLKHLTSRNSDSPGKADFYSSDEEESTPRRRSVQVRNPSPASKYVLVRYWRSRFRQAFFLSLAVWGFACRFCIRTFWFALLSKQTGCFARFKHSSREFVCWLNAQQKRSFCSPVLFCVIQCVVVCFISCTKPKHLRSSSNLSGPEWSWRILLYFLEAAVKSLASCVIVIRFRDYVFR